jgi:hypothetical protein
MFGIFASLFGLASNEIYPVTFGENQLTLSATPIATMLTLPEGKSLLVSET